MIQSQCFFWKQKEGRKQSFSPSPRMSNTTTRLTRLHSKATATKNRSGSGGILSSLSSKCGERLKGCAMKGLVDVHTSIKYHGMMTTTNEGSITTNSSGALCCCCVQLLPFVSRRDPLLHLLACVCVGAPSAAGAVSAQCEHRFFSPRSP